LPVHIGEKPGLVEDFEVYREAIVDLIRYAHGDGVLEGLPALAGAARGRRVQKADQHARPRRRDDVELDITLIQRDQRARHEGQDRGAAAQDQSYGHDVKSSA